MATHQDSAGNSQPKARRTIQINMDNSDLLGQNAQPTQQFRSSAKGAHREAGDSVPTEHIRHQAVHTMLVRDPGKKGMKTPPDKWVVGWLIVMEGPMQGASFTLGIGNNHIGRGSRNTIVLADDPGISEDSQIIITYVKGKDDFYITPSLRGTQSTMLNDRILLSPQVVQAWDIITLSDDTKLCFLPFCGPKFHWDYSGNSSAQ